MIIKRVDLHRRQKLLVKKNIIKSSSDKVVGCRLRFTKNGMDKGFPWLFY